MTDNYLYVAFDNSADGVVMFRTDDATASSRADFEGVSGCSADQHPGSCDGLGGNGFGDVENSRVFSSTAVNDGTPDYIYLVLGNGSDPINVRRFIEQ